MTIGNTCACDLVENGRGLGAPYRTAGLATVAGRAGIAVLGALYKGMTDKARVMKRSYIAESAGITAGFVAVSFFIATYLCRCPLASRRALGHSPYSTVRTLFLSGLPRLSR